MTSSPDPEPFPPLGSVLVTGGCGFLGSHIVSHILSHYDLESTSVSVLDLRTSSNSFPGASYYTADLTSASAVREVLEKCDPDVVIHTASPVFGSGGNKKARELMWKVNVEGTRLLLEESKKVGSVKAFVYTSSASVVSDCINDLKNADERWSVVTGKDQQEYYSDTKVRIRHSLDVSRLAVNSFLRNLRPKAELTAVHACRLKQRNWYFRQTRASPLLS